MKLFQVATQCVLLSSLATTLACTQKKGVESDVEASRSSSPATTAKTLVHCAARGGGESFTLSRTDFAHIKLNKDSSEIISAKKESRKEADGSLSLIYNLDTIAGNLIEVSIPVAGHGSLKIFDRGVIGNVCDAQKSSVDQKALDQLVREAKPKARYQFATCTAMFDSASAGKVGLSVRAGMSANSLVFETDDLPRDGGSLRYVASKLHEEGAMGSFYQRFVGQGVHIYHGAGTHTQALKGMYLRTNNESKASSLYLELADSESSTLPDLKDCKIQNLDYVKKVLKVESAR